MRQAQEDGDFKTDVIRDAVVHVAATARATEIAPERLLAIIKLAVRQESLDHLSWWWRNLLTDRIVRWTIEAYFGVPPGSL